MANKPIDRVDISLANWFQPEILKDIANLDESGRRQLVRQTHWAENVYINVGSDGSITSSPFTEVLPQSVFQSIVLRQFEETLGIIKDIAPFDKNQNLEIDREEMKAALQASFPKRDITDAMVTETMDKLQWRFDQELIPVFMNLYQYCLQQSGSEVAAVWAAVWATAYPAFSWLKGVKIFLSNAQKF